FKPHAQSVALRAHAERAVETEQLRTGRFIADAAFHTGKLRAVERFGVRSADLQLDRQTLTGHFVIRGARPAPGRLTAFYRHKQPALAQSQRTLDGFRQARADSRARLKPVDDHVDRVLHLLLEQDLIRQLNNASIDPGPKEPLFAEIVKQVAV